MQYEKLIHVRSNENAVLDEAAKLLLARGFNFDSQTENEIRLTGPGMRSTKQDPILGATAISLRQSHATRGKIAVSADLGGVRWMSNFITFFPPLLIAGILTINLVVLTVVMKNNLPQGLISGLGVGGAIMVFLFSVFGRLMRKRIRSGTENAIDACIKNADELAQRH